MDINGTVATLCSGGEGFGIGAKSAGLKLLWGIEHAADMAAVANANLGNHVIVAGIQDVDPRVLDRPEFLHVSPPCPNFSTAKAGAREGQSDIELAQAVVRYITILQPRVFTLENVWLYRRSTSWSIIRDALYRCGYWLDVAHVNAADFGVPQTRKRLIVRAVRGSMVPYLPEPEPWVGWFEAIEDLIPTLEETEFAPWQRKRMPDELRDTVLLSQGISRDHNGNEYGITMRDGEQPAFTVTANCNMNGIRAFLVTGQYDRLNTEADRRPQCRLSDAPANTVTASMKQDWRVFVVGGDNGGRSPTVRSKNEPAATVTAQQSKAPVRGIVGNRIVRTNQRCLARWQTFPDWYELPESRVLASRIIGNAVPPLLAEKMLRQLR